MIGVPKVTAAGHEGTLKSDLVLCRTEARYSHSKCRQNKQSHLAIVDSLLQNRQQYTTDRHWIQLSAELTELTCTGLERQTRVDNAALSHGEVAARIGHVMPKTSNEHLFDGEAENVAGEAIGENWRSGC
jgi:hypothetical protein